MSTNSENDFEWSVKLFGEWGFEVGIASLPLNQEDEWISWHDQNAILYNSYNFGSMIIVRLNRIHDYLPMHSDEGDVIRFRFQPQRKKLVIELVRL